jgi:hypothetical protein
MCVWTSLESFEDHHASGSVHPGFDRTLTPPMNGKARTETIGEPGKTGTSAIARCLPPMMGMPLTDKAQELLRLARRFGIGRDELLRLIQELP